jgi:tetraacyldisaccharide 4'-kinase
MTPPDFWRFGQTPPKALVPLSRLWARATARRVARSGWVAPVPVICCGNAGLGGAGKTPLALDLARRLARRGLRVGFLSRGYGGRLRGPLLVDAARHSAADVGDEPLLLARQAPVWIGADRVLTARLAIAQGCNVLVMDDGLQNPGLAKTLSLMVVDGGTGFGNGFVMPAGPLRETPEEAARRCHASVMIGVDTTDAASRAAQPVLLARLAAPKIVLPSRLVAFAGIGRPEKFFATLASIGHTPHAALPFPDHHRYTTRDLRRVFSKARRHDAALITTEKDHVRLPAALRERILTLPIALVWQDEATIEALLDRMLQDHMSQDHMSQDGILNG